MDMRLIRPARGAFAPCSSEWLQRGWRAGLRWKAPCLVPDRSAFPHFDWPHLMSVDGRDATARFRRFIQLSFASALSPPGRSSTRVWVLICRPAFTIRRESLDGWHFDEKRPLPPTCPENVETPVGGSMTRRVGVSPDVEPGTAAGRRCPPPGCALSGGQRHPQIADNDASCRGTACRPPFAGRHWRARVGQALHLRRIGAHPQATPLRGARVHGDALYMLHASLAADCGTLFPLDNVPLPC